jgi:Tfp pilus assembly protein PilO
MSPRWKALARQTGWPGLVGVLALTASGVLALVMEPRMEAQITALNADIDQHQAARRAQLAKGGLDQKPVATPAQWLSELPSTAMRQERLADLLEQGLRQGLVAARTEHRLNVDAPARLERLRINMPLTGSYAQLRAYIEAALNHDAALSLDALRLRRTTPQAPELEAELQWSLHGRLEAHIDAPKPPSSATPGRAQP